ncbi:TerC family protein [Thorsellia kenyensis]|uniref:Transporter associated domain-containing protein n=1 Tax=Thorsellia kenyensis TaxID=1549888 RepID=A0ABV6CAK8_9GAMM
MEWIADPTAWAGLVSLILLEIVLGIDNLIFIAILSEKVPKHQRDKARIMGLSLALIMRVGLLFGISWLASLTTPLFTLFGHTFNARDLILITGGLFLLFKATMELNSKLEGEDHHSGETRKTTKFWVVVTQIVILDAVFSLDSVITAIGMVEEISIMIIAVSVAIGLMLLASKPLTRFVNKHPTLVILCLSFLLMIGFSLVAEGFGVKIPKGYLYAAIAFSLIIELFNQIASFNRKKSFFKNKALREKTAQAVLNLLHGKDVDENDINSEKDTSSTSNKEISTQASIDAFNQQERLMVGQILKLHERTVSSIMTIRQHINYAHLTDTESELYELLRKQPHTRLIVKKSPQIDEPSGIVHVIDVLLQKLNDHPLRLDDILQKPLVFPENLTLLSALDQFRQAKTHFAFVANEFGTVEGIVTLTDIMETIAGEFPTAAEDIDERRQITQDNDGSILVSALLPIEDLLQKIYINLPKKREYTTIGGLIMEDIGSIPKEGDAIIIDKYSFTITKMQGYKIDQVRILPLDDNEE